MLSRPARAQVAPPPRRQTQELGALMTGIVAVRRQPLLHERVGDALHALSREPER